MPLRLKQGQLTAIEKRIVKALLATNERNQDIQALVNLGRSHTVNSARITEVKQNNAITPATEDEVLRYKWVKQSHDMETGLNIVEDERLVRAREAMMLAVQIFNSASLHFKSEVYLVTWLGPTFSTTIIYAKALQSLTKMEDQCCSAKC